MSDMDNAEALLRGSLFVLQEYQHIPPLWVKEWLPESTKDMMKRLIIEIRKEVDDKSERRRAVAKVSHHCVKCKWYHFSKVDDVPQCRHIENRQSQGFSYHHMEVSLDFGCIRWEKSDE